MPKMKSIREAAIATGLSYNCIRKWCLTGEFNGFVKAGAKYLINMDLLAAYLNGQSEREG